MSEELHNYSLITKEFMYHLFVT